MRRVTRWKCDYGHVHANKKRAAACEERWDKFYLDADIARETAKEIMARGRLEEVQRRRILGESYSDIADSLGISERRAALLVTMASKQLAIQTIDG
jgi:hypothetical protein